MAVEHNLSVSACTYNMHGYHSRSSFLKQLCLDNNKYTGKSTKIKLTVHSTALVSLLWAVNDISKLNTASYGTLKQKLSYTENTIG